MKLTYFLFSVFISVLMVNAQQPNWPVLKHYDKNHIAKIAMPIGGIGTETVSLNGKGALVDWEIMNRPAKGFRTITMGNDAPLFAIHIEQDEKTTPYSSVFIELDCKYWSGEQEEALRKAMQATIMR